MQKKAVKKEQKNTKKSNIQKTYINPKISIIILNVNGLKNSIRRQRLSDWIKTRSNYNRKHTEDSKIQIS